MVFVPFPTHDKITVRTSRVATVSALCGYQVYVVDRRGGRSGKGVGGRQHAVLPKRAIILKRDGVDALINEFGH